MLINNHKRSAAPQPTTISAAFGQLRHLYKRHNGTLAIVSLLERLRSELLPPKTLSYVQLQDLADVASAYMRDAQGELLRREGFDFQRCDDQQPVVGDEWGYSRPVLSRLEGYYAITQRHTGRKHFVAEVLELNDDEMQAMRAWSDSHGFSMDVRGHPVQDHPGVATAVRLMPKRQSKKR